MPAIDINKPETIKFLIESYDKTARLRMKWNSIHKDELKVAASLSREEKGYHEVDVIRGAMELGMDTITRDHISAGYNKRKKPLFDGTFIQTTKNLRKGHSISKVGLGDPAEDPRLARPDDSLTFDPVMRPIDPAQKEILYNDLPTFGRKVYLRSRNTMAPEKKYYFAECSGMFYGWRMCDSYFGRHAPAYGRVWNLTRNSRSRTGPHPDPKHYNSSDAPAFAKCTT